MGVNECSYTICDRQIVEKVQRKSLTSINVTHTRPSSRSGSDNVDPGFVWNVSIAQCLIVTCV